MLFRLLPWETEGSGIPCRLCEVNESPPPAEALAPGVYYVRTTLDLTALGYTYLHDRVTLSAPPLLSVRRQDWEAGPGREITPLDEEAAGYYAYQAPSIFGGGPGRLEQTLPQAAGSLMSAWVWNSYHRRGSWGFQLSVSGLHAGFVIGREDRIELIGVIPGFRGRGVGTALLRQVRLTAVGDTWVTTESTNEAALRMYQQAGFTVQERRPLWWAQVVSP